MTRKIALLSDVHGNSTALEAVLADAESQQVTDYWFWGTCSCQELAAEIS